MKLVCNEVQAESDDEPPIGLGDDALLLQTHLAPPPYRLPAATRSARAPIDGLCTGLHDVDGALPWVEFFYATATRSRVVPFPWPACTPSTLPSERGERVWPM